MKTITQRFTSVRVPMTATWGLRIALATALISGVSVWLNGYAVKQVPDAAVFTTLKNAVAAAFLILAVVASGGLAEARGSSRSTWAKLAFVGLIGGSIPFLLFFTGLANATAPGAAFIQKTLFVWVALLAVPFLRERLGGLQITAMVVLLGGLVLLSPPNLAGAGWGTGETMIAAATLFWAVEVIVVKRWLSAVSPTLVGAGRLGFGMVFLVGYLAATGSLGAVATVSTAGWIWVMVSGTILAAYVATWFAALRRAPAGAVTSVLVVGAVLTSALQALSDGRIAGPTVVAGGLVLVCATVAIGWLALRSNRTAERARLLS